uniref:Uncharacterized protein n=1 Tax=Globisporangium ultimum (strain ATCC 200006 / CBS 805.95 / DAOM BR144) TaxID=431595 RepID=K3X0M6_GLOUD
MASVKILPRELEEEDEEAEEAHDAPGRLLLQRFPEQQPVALQFVPDGRELARERHLLLLLVFVVVFKQFALADAAARALQVVVEEVVEHGDRDHAVAHEEHEHVLQRVVRIHLACGREVEHDGVRGHLTDSLEEKLRHQEGRNRVTAALEHLALGQRDHISARMTLEMPPKHANPSSATYPPTTAMRSLSLSVESLFRLPPKFLELLSTTMMKSASTVAHHESTMYALRCEPQIGNTSERKPIAIPKHQGSMSRILAESTWYDCISSSACMSGSTPRLRHD